MKRLSLSLFALVLVLPALADGWHRADAEKLLQRWSDALIERQLAKHPDVHLRGGILCGACVFVHGRVADLAFPFTHLWVRTGDRRYLDAAVEAVDYVEHNLLGADGRSYNDVKSAWWGITAFAHIAMAKTLLAYGDRLPADVKSRWTAICRRQSEFIFTFFSDDNPRFRPVINYPSAYCESMALAGRLFGDARFTAAARAKAMQLTDRFICADGLYAGEGHPIDYVSPRGCRFIDHGYDMEESLDALAETAEMLDDETLAARVERSALAHLEFMLPDGGLDNSMGSRAAKWTYYGSRTSDGLLPILGFLARRGHPGAVRAIRRHLDLLARCTLADGLLAGGLMHVDADEPACVHHAFAHAKSLVDLVRSSTPESAPDAPMPREREYGVKHFPSIDTDLVALGPWRASFSANDAFPSGAGTTVSGGSLSLLYHLDVGPLLVGTMAKYDLVEPQNMQDQRHDDGTLCFTPRIVAGKYTSSGDYKAKVESRLEHGAYVCSSAGGLADWKGYAPGGKTGDYRLSYRLDKDALAVSATSSAAEWQYHLPVVCGLKDRVTLAGNEATIERAGRKLRVVCNRKLTLLRTRRGERVWTPIAGVMAAYFVVDAKGGDEVTFTLAVGK